MLIVIKFHIDALEELPATFDFVILRQHMLRLNFYELEQAKELNILMHQRI